MRSDQTYEGIHAVSTSQVLADFLDRIHKADDPSVELDLIRAQGAEVSRKKLRCHSGLLRLEYRCSMHSSHNFDRPRINNRGGLLHHSTRNSSKVRFSATTICQVLRSARAVLAVGVHLGISVKLWMETLAPPRARSFAGRKTMVIWSNLCIVGDREMGNRRISFTGGRLMGMS